MSDAVFQFAKRVALEGTGAIEERPKDVGLEDAEQFGDLWALRWSDLLRVEEKQLDVKGVDLFHSWLKASFASGKPLNQL